MKKHLFTARHGAIHVQIVGPNPERLRKLIESQLTLAERLGEPLDSVALADGIVDINQDVEAGRIAKPSTVEEYADAFVREYRANTASAIANIDKAPLALVQDLRKWGLIS